MRDTVLDIFEVPGYDQKKTTRQDKLDKSLSNTMLHRVVASVSLVKKGRTYNYFKGTQTDGTTMVCLVGFNADQQKSIKQFIDSKEAPKFSDCELKQANRGMNMGIFSELDLDDGTPSEIKLAALELMNVYDRVSVKVKVPEYF